MNRETFDRIYNLKKEIVRLKDELNNHQNINYKLHINVMGDFNECDVCLKFKDEIKNSKNELKLLKKTSKRI